MFETFTPGRPTPPGLEVLTPSLQDSFKRAQDRVANAPQSVYRTLFPKAMALERAFVKAGGLLIAGTDPTGSGGVVPGFADQRQIELLVEAGFTPLEAIAIGTSNGAKYLGLDADIGSLEPGKLADLIVVDGNPLVDIRQSEKVLYTVVNGRLYDAATMNEAGNHPRPRSKYWWEKD